MITLLCEAEAFPEPTYEWFLSGGSFGGNILPNQEGTLLVFSPVLFGDQGDYYCTATSSNITVQSENATVTGRL